MNSSATSTVGFAGTPKTPATFGRSAPADPVVDTETHSDDGFDAAFRAILQFGRETASNSTSDEPVDPLADKRPPSQDKPKTWTPNFNDTDAPLAAGDLLLAGGALTPEGGDHGVDATIDERRSLETEHKPLPDTDPDMPAIDAGPLKPAAAIQAAVTVAPASATKPAAPAERPEKADSVQNADTAEIAGPPEGIDPVVDDRPAAPMMTVHPGGTQTPIAAPASDPFEGLRKLVQAVDRPVTPTRSQTVPLSAAPVVETGEPKPVEASPPDKLTTNSTIPDRPSPPVTREAGPTPAVNLTVVEARQFPGVAPLPASASAIVSALSGNESWHAMLGGSGTIPTSPANRSGAPLNTLTIQLRPAELGSVNAVLRLSGDQLVVELKVETIEAYRQLSESQNAIVKALKGQGYSIEQITIQQAAPDRSAPFQSAVAGQNNGQASDGTPGQPGHENPMQPDGGRTGQDNSHDDGYENESRGPDDPSGSNTSRTGADGAVYL